MAGEHQPLVRVGDLLNRKILAINDGYRVTNKELGTVGVPFVRGGDIGDGEIDTQVADHVLPQYLDRIKTKLTCVDDVAFITKGNVGRVGILRPGQPPVVFAPQVSYWRVLDRTALDSRFLFYVLRSRDFQAQLDAVKTHGSMVADYVSLSDQASFWIPVPPVEQQRAISEILGALDDKIALNRRMNQTLEAITQALFRSWFVDFDPVRIKAEGRWPEGMDAKTAALFPSSLVNSELGSIPERWRVACLGDFLRTIRAQINPSDLARDTPYIGLEHMPRGSICLGTWESAEKVTSDKLAFRKGQILFGKLRPYFKKVGVALTNGVCSSDILVLDTTEPAYFGWSLGHLTRQEFIDFTSNVSSGTRMPRVSWEDIASFKVAVPPGPELLSAFTALVQLFLKKIECAVAESKTLTELRDTLLPKLLSREIRVGEAEAQVAASA